jgi:voltage-gated potassium channel
MPDAKREKFKELRFQLRFSFAVIFGVMTLGTVGYMVIEGWNFLDSLFMTVITLSSVGYGETRPLDTPGRIFTIVLILMGVAALGNLLSQLARAVAEGYFQEGLQGRRRFRMLSKIENHYIVCGYGRIGQQVCRDFVAEGAAFVILEKDPDLVRKAEQDGFLALPGDASSDETLLEAGIERARCVLSALPSDAENLYVVLSAKILNPKILAIARASSDEGALKLERVGADKVVSPYVTGAKRMAALALRPQVIDLLETVSIGGSQAYIEEFLLPKVDKEFTCPYLHKSLKEAELRSKSGALVLAIRRDSGDFIGNPTADARLEPGDLLICMGTGEQLRKLAQVILPTNLS